MQEILNKQWTMNMPVPVEFGAGCIDRLSKYVGGFHRAFIVDGLHTTKAAWAADRVCKVITGAGLECEVFHEISPEPHTDEVENGAARAREFKADVVVGLGGGSAMDAAKAIAVAATHDGPITDYRVGGPCSITGRTLPNIAITTTSGTGSHIGRVAVVSDEANHQKRPLGSDFLYPLAAFCDVDLLRLMPPGVTATSGFDAFAQVLEGYLSTVENPIGNLCAQEGIRIMARALPEVYRNGDDVELRAAMAWGDTIGGISVATQGVITPHVIAMVLGGRYGVGHARAIACVTKACLEHSRPGAVAKLANVARLMGCTEQLNDEALADWAIEAVQNLIRSLELAKTPADYGVQEDVFESIGAEVVRDFAYRVEADPVPTDAAGLAGILRRACDIS